MFYNIIIINLLFYPFSKQKNTPKKNKIAEQNKRCNEVRVKIILWLYGA